MHANDHLGIFNESLAPYAPPLAIALLFKYTFAAMIRNLLCIAFFIPAKKRDSRSINVTRSIIAK